jgi:hypothetical protein
MISGGFSMAWRNSSWAKAVFSSSAFLFDCSQKNQPYRTRLLLEPLEDRCVPTTITPTTFADGILGSGSLRDAVLQFNADPGTGDDTIQLLAGTYTLTIRNTGGHHETAGFEGDLNITNTNHRLIIQGAGPSTIVDASQLQDRVFDIVNPGTVVVFQNLVIRGGLAQDDGSSGALAGSTDALGGGIFNNAGNVTLDHVVLTNNVAQGGKESRFGGDGYNGKGGGVYAASGTLTITGSTLSSNKAIGGDGSWGGTYGPGGNGGAGRGGGLYSAGGMLSVTGSTLSSNQAIGGNGGFPTSGIGGNGGVAQGGGLYVGGGAVTFTSSTLSTNSAKGGDGIGGGGYGTGGPGQGGGLYVGSGTVTLTSSTLSTNSASGGIGNPIGTGQGGGLYVVGGTVTLTNSNLSTNSAKGGEVDYDVFDGGAGQGGGVYVGGGTVTLTNVTLSTNYASGGNGSHFYSGPGRNGGAGQGGGLYVGGSTSIVTLTSSTLSENSAFGGNGGIGHSESSPFIPATAGGNGGAGQGGGLCVASGTVTVSNTTISSNTVHGGSGGNGGNHTGGRGGGNGGNGGAAFGGGLYLGGGTLTVTNGTLALNTAQASMGGTGGTGSPPGNPGTGQTGQGGGVRNAGGTVNARNTLFGNDAAAGAPDFSGPLASSGYNLFGNSSGGSGYTATDLLDVDPLLGPLQDNGGPTFSHGLLAGSPALNAGDPAQLGVTDQRGVVRAGGVNIGAYQASASTFVITAAGTVTAGTPFDVTVQAVDVFGQVAFGYRGTVTFSVTDPDPAVVLPLDYTFTADDAGTHTFTGGFTLITPGTWTLTLADLANGLSIDVTVTVNP